MRKQLIPFVAMGDIIFGYPMLNAPEPVVSPVNFFIHGCGSNPCIKNKVHKGIVPTKKLFTRTGIRASGRNKQQFVQV